MLAHKFCVSRKGGTGGGGWCHPQGAVHMAVAMLGCKRTMVDTRWANSCPGYMSRLGKRYCHLLGGSFLPGKASWSPSRCLPAESADCCMLVNEWACLSLRSQVCLLSLKVHLGSVFWSQSTDRNENMVRYRHVYAKSSLQWKNLGVKGL